MSEPFTPISHIGEFGLIDRMKERLGGTGTGDDVLCGIGDDAAVYRVAENRAHVVTADALVEGVHFERGFMPLAHLGRKAIAVNVSDVAAMNAVARYAVVTVGLPRSLSVQMVESLYEGMREACAEYGVRLVGGDTTAAPQLTLSVTVVGEVPIDRVAYRSGARPGDVLCVTGDVGSAYAGLQILLEQQRALRELGEGYSPELDAYRYVIRRQLTPTARTDVVEEWARKAVRPNALIDVSDGVASEVHHICRSSGCGALVSESALPLAPETRLVADERLEDPESYALFGGEDYELLFAVDPSHLDRLDPIGYTQIGRMTDAADGVVLQTVAGELIPLETDGFSHFGGGPDDD